MRTISTMLFFVLLSLGLFGKSQMLQAQGKINVKGKTNVNKENVTVGGYDVVAYFAQNKAVRGSQKHATTYNRVNYWFSTAENKDSFAKTPEKYLPQYGGWCAFGMAIGNGKVPSDPETFKLYNGKLYLFFNDYYKGEPVNTIVPWNADEAQMKKKADANWRAVVK